MKNYIFLIISVVLLSCNGGTSGSKIDASLVKNNYSVLEDFEQSSGGPKIIFNELQHEFKSIVKGDELEHTFYFVNAGDSPLILTNVKGSCGCTNVEYTEEPIMPGDKGLIKAEVSTANKSVGKLFKVSVTVESNAIDKKMSLYLKGTPKAE